jgi:hypothetical protein
MRLWGRLLKEIHSPIPLLFFLLLPVWKTDGMAGAMTIILNHEVTSRIEASIEHG